MNTTQCILLGSLSTLSFIAGIILGIFLRLKRNNLVLNDISIVDTEELKKIKTFLFRKKIRAIRASCSFLNKISGNNVRGSKNG